MSCCVVIGWDVLRRSVNRYATSSSFNLTGTDIRISTVVRTNIDDRQGRNQLSVRHDALARHRIVG